MTEKYKMAKPEEFIIVDEWYHLIPPIVRDDEETFKKDIIENGVRIPLIVTPDMEIIDGYQRHRIVRQNPDAPQLLPYVIEEIPRKDIPQHIFTINFQRRHLSRYNRAKISLEAARNWGWFEREKKKEIIENWRNSSRGRERQKKPHDIGIMEVISGFFGVPEYYVRAAKRLHDAGEFNLVTACADGTMKVNKALEMLDKKEKQQERAVLDILRNNVLFAIPMVDFKEFETHWNRLKSQVWQPKLGDIMEVKVSYKKKVVKPAKREEKPEKPWKSDPFQDWKCSHGVVGGCHLCYKDPENPEHRKKSATTKQDAIRIPIDAAEMSGFRVLPDKDLKPCSNCEEFWDEFQETCTIDLEKDVVPDHCRKWRRDVDK